MFSWGQSLSWPAWERISSSRGGTVTTFNSESMCVKVKEIVVTLILRKYDFLVQY